MKNIVFNLINQKSIDKIAKNSYKNWHAIGVNYLCLHRSPELTAKVYIFRPNECKLNNSQFLVNPHSHRYNFHFSVLAGQIINIYFKYDEILGETWSQYDYETPLSSNPSVNFVRHTKYFQLHSNCTDVYMPHNFIHTLSFDTTKYHAMFTWQFKTLAQKTTLLTKGDLPSYDNLYLKYNNTKEIAQLISELKDMI